MTKEPKSYAEAIRQRLRAENIRDLEAAGYVVIAPGEERDALVRCIEDDRRADDERPAGDAHRLNDVLDRLTRPVRRSP
jgi:hypothetical protein